MRCLLLADPRAIALMLLCASPLFAADYYVSPGGSDETGTGSEAAPWRTIAHALESVSAGDNLYLRAGVYSEQLVSVQDGSSGAPITISSYGNEKVFIDGAGVTTGNNGVLISHSYLILSGFTVRNWADNGLEIFDCAYLELRSLTVTAVSGGIALTGSVHDFVVDSCLLYDYYAGAGGFGFDATPYGGTISNGVISNSQAYITGGAFDNCDGFALGHDGVSNIRFENCHVDGVGDAFDISGENILLERCSATNSSYGGGYKLWRESVTMVNCIGHSNIVNVELDYDSDVNRGVNARLINCSFYEPIDANVLIENTAGGSTLEMVNCILAGGTNTGLYFDGDSIRGYTGDYNLFHLSDPSRMIALGERDFTLSQVQAGDWTAFSGQDGHTQVVFSVTDIFQDTTRPTPDLHLREHSAAIDNGTPHPDAPSVDFDNYPRNVGPIDIGAYEFGAGVVEGIADPRQEHTRSSSLSQNYPNPFNPTTTIKYALPHAGNATLRVYNVLGERVATLFDGDHSAGTFKASWDASGMPSGVYFYRLSAGGYVESRKMVLMR